MDARINGRCTRRNQRDARITEAMRVAIERNKRALKGCEEQLKEIKEHCKDVRSN
jgi:hypothetical protein